MHLCPLENHHTGHSVARERSNPHALSYRKSFTKSRAAPPIRHAVAVDFVWIALLVGVMGGMWWVAYRMEPHWASRDGHRFLCTAQELEGGKPIGHPRETRVLVTADGALYVTQKRMMRRRTSMWTLIGKSPEPPRKLQVYVAQQRSDGVAMLSHLALRIPNKSRCVSVLDGVLTDLGLNPSPSTPGSAAPAAPPDRD